MEIKKKKLINTLLVVIIFVVILLLSWLLLGGKSYSKYKEEVNAMSNTQIAKPVFVVNGTSNIEINGKEDMIYYFDIKNYNENGISEVEMDYFIEIVNHSQVNLEFELTKKDEKIELQNNKTGVISLANVIKQDDKYELKIKYKDKPAVFSDVQGNVQIKVEAVQAKKD